MCPDFHRIDDLAVKRRDSVVSDGAAGDQCPPASVIEPFGHRYPADSGENVGEVLLVLRQTIHTQHAVLHDRGNGSAIRLDADAKDGGRIAYPAEEGTGEAAPAKRAIGGHDQNWRSNFRQSFPKLPSGNPA